MQPGHGRDPRWPGRFVRLAVGMVTVRTLLTGGLTIALLAASLASVWGTSGVGTILGRPHIHTEPQLTRCSTPACRQAS
jgi:hypothetical protein